MFSAASLIRNELSMRDPELSPRAFVQLKTLPSIQLGSSATWLAKVPHASVLL